MAEKPEAAGDLKPEITAAQLAAKMKGVEVLVAKTDPKTRKPVVEGGVHATEKRQVTEADIIAFAGAGRTYTVVTADGRKHQVAI